MSEFLQKFFKWGAEFEPSIGLYTPQHLIICFIVLVIWAGLAILFGILSKNKTREEKLKVVKVAACVSLGTELIGWIYLLLREGITSSITLETWLTLLPFWLCSIQFFIIPVAAFAKGRIQEICLDFVAIFGFLCALMGTFCNAGEFNGNHVLSFRLWWQIITHVTSGFVALYVFITKLNTMKVKNMWAPVTILTIFEIIALIIGRICNFNYMFLLESAGTPFEIFNTFAGGNLILYDIFVILGMNSYLFVFYGIYYLVMFFIRRNKANKNAET